MSDTPMWMVRAGEGASHIDEFREQGRIGIGWNDVGSLKPGASRDQILTRVLENWNYSARKAAITASQLDRFASEIQKGDRVVSYDPGLREYLIGTIQGDYAFSPEAHFAHGRSVEWNGSVRRDLLSLGTRNSLGAISTLFRIHASAAQEILSVAAGDQKKTAMPDADEPVDASQLLDDIEEKAKEFIKDRVIALDWEQMQELVAGLLRAMGYKTRVSPAGADQGKDIIASPDGLGFEQPRIVVEVKHRPNSSTDAPMLRSYLGGRHKDDRGLYVSTGGFTKDARYEAERAAIPVTLLDAGGLVQSLVENYESLDVATKQLVPLQRIYWPA